MTTSSSCDVSSPGAAVAESSRVSGKGSRVHRFHAPAEGAASFEGVPVQEYKAAADHHCGVRRSVIVGESGEKTKFHVRYFEIEPGGHSTMEHHRHEHVVTVIRGVGQVSIEGTWHEVSFGDTIYVAPREVHQLRNVGDEPFGFLCVVDAKRDKPKVVASQARP